MYKLTHAVDEKKNAIKDFVQLFKTEFNLTPEMVCNALQRNGAMQAGIDLPVLFSVHSAPALFHAVLHCQVDITVIETLIDKGGSDVNIQDSHGTSPLMAVSFALWSKSG